MPTLSDPLNAGRLVALQELTGLTQTDLSKRLGMSQSYLSLVMRRERPFTPDIATRAAHEFLLPESFFTVPHTTVDAAIPTFRKNSTAKTSDEKRIVRLTKEATRFWDSVATSINYPHTHIHDVPLDSTPEQAAKHVRNILGLAPDARVPNMVRLAEKLGVAVITNLDNTDMPSDHVGASLPTQEITHPLIALTAQVRGDVARMTIGHELAHLIYDRKRQARITSIRSPEEKRAYEFSGALLAPAAMMQEKVNETTRLMEYAKIKAEYGISISALIMRARTLGLITDKRQRSLFIQHNAHGWRNNEPVSVPAEKPSLLRQAIQARWNGIYPLRIALDLGLSPEWVSRWTGEEDDSDMGQLASLDQWRNKQAQGMYD